MADYLNSSFIESLLLGSAGLSSVAKYWSLLNEATHEYVVGFISDTVVKVLVGRHLNQSLHQPEEKEDMQGDKRSSSSSSHQVSLAVWPGLH